MATLGLVGMMCAASSRLGWDPDSGNSLLMLQKKTVLRDLSF
jgi:hypothetical protein